MVVGKNVKGFWRYQAGDCAFSIRPHNGFWVPFFEDEHLGTYQSPQIALQELVGGSTFTPSSGVWPAELELPDDLSDWVYVPFGPAP
ncbi:hypothetical protein [Labrenzia sp. OB1]|uniref:hypothetical protein n=1 Tax=Labrenzia sp. OB1 TaxID=1561204 RepID=UPI0007B27E43|nr:hypothetical protein [Labrenzia sp. OB1]KZM48266.1 hypothetical protein OA90_21140 [Labrenzia sp. OB1]